MQQILAGWPDLPASDEALRAAFEEHPYFQWARLVHVGVLAQGQVSGLEAYVAAQACLLPNRQRLAVLLHTKPQTPTNEPFVDTNFELLQDPAETTKTLETQGEAPAKGEILEFLESQPQVANVSDEPTNQLIDQFLQDLPNMASTRPEAPSPQDTPEPQDDISLQSVQEPDDLASEQLALIYIRQGYTQKAIEIYRNLSLRFPEKSAYFAARIENLGEPS